MESQQPYPEMPPLSPEYERLWMRHLRNKREYETFLRVSDIKGSISNGFRAKGIKSGRQHHMMSKLEFWYFLILDCSPSVVEIREQYPSDPEITWRIAHDLGYKHNHLADGITIGSVDFLITVMEDGKLVHKARDVKPWEILDDDDRTRQKLEITRRYYAKDNIHYGLVTDRKINTVLADNIFVLRGAHDLESFNIPDIQATAVREVLEPRLGEKRDLSTMALECDSTLRLPPGTSIKVVHQLVLTGGWFFDLRRKFDSNKPETNTLITPVHEAPHLNRVAA